MLYKKISISFDPQWVLSKRGDEVLPVEAFVSDIEKQLKIEAAEESLTECELLVKLEGSEDVQKIVSEVLRERFALSVDSDVITFTLTDAEAPKKETPQKEAPEQAPKANSEQTPVQAEKPSEAIEDKTAHTALEEIQSLVGATEFKALAEEIALVAPGLLRNKCPEALLGRSYLFSINDGNGLSTYVKLLARLMAELGLVEKKAEEQIVELSLPAEEKNRDGNPFSEVISLFGRFGKADGKIICMDISEWMTKATEKKFRDFLMELENHVGENVFVFRVPFVEKEVLRKLRCGLADVLTVREVSFPPFTTEELIRCAKDQLAAKGYEAQEDIWEIFEARIAEEKNDGRFYGINTVHKIIMDMIYKKQLYNAKNDIIDTVIRREEIRDLTQRFEEGGPTGYAILDGMVGMAGIRKKVEEIIAQIMLSVKSGDLSSPCIHMRFVGNPGTGKTTVARVVGQILKEHGILRNGSFFEYSGRDFCGRYVGETAPKTAAMCRDAYGSVLFIDEAYSLYRHEGRGSADYGQEAIDTLIAEMENHRNDLVVIMAGYPEEMQTLMKGNAGLESRMPFVIEFSDYTRQELCEIFFRMAKKTFVYDDAFAAAVKSYFEALPDEILKAKNFSNARFVRNLFERTWGKAALRAQLGGEEQLCLTVEDFHLASGEKEFSTMMEKPHRSLGFV